jgi:hypothetical protein
MHLNKVDQETEKFLMMGVRPCVCVCVCVRERERERERDLFKNCPVLIELIMAGQMVKTRRERHRQRLETCRDVCNGKQVLILTASSTDPSVKLRQFCTTQGSFTTTVAPRSLVPTKRWSGVASGDQQQPQRRRRGASLGFVTL